MIRAVEVKKPTSALDFERRLKAVVNFSELDAAEPLAAANKRVNNILAKNGKGEFTEVNNALLTDEAEKALADALATVKPKVAEFYNQGDYQQGLLELATLKDVIDAFFDNVMVMADDEQVKNNRLAILAELQNLFMHTADISVL